MRSRSPEAHAFPNCPRCGQPLAALDIHTPLEQQQFAYLRCSGCRNDYYYTYASHSLRPGWWDEEDEGSDE